MRDKNSKGKIAKEFDPKVHMFLTAEDHKNLSDIDFYKKVTWYKEASKLKSGTAFGELALLNNLPRSATV